MSKREGDGTGRSKNMVNKEKTKQKHTSKHISQLKQNLQKNVDLRASNEVHYMR